MTRIKLELDTETFGRLVEAAVTERRPANWQAEVMLMRALGVQPPEVWIGASSKSNAVPAESQSEETAHVSV
jgi:hypothetical protein